MSTLLDVIGAGTLKATAILLGIAIGVAFAIGWFAPSRVDVAIDAQPAPTAPVFVHPGAVVAEAARRMGAVVSGAEVATADEGPDLSVDVTPAPPPIDIAEHFRRELSAVVTEGGARVLVFVDETRALRRVAAGSAYRDGWRVQSINQQDVVLIRRGGETRRIPIIGAAPTGVSVESTGEPGAAPRRLALSRQDAKGSNQ